MTPFFDHPNEAPSSAGGWHNLGLLTASLAVMLVFAATANLLRQSPFGARPSVEPTPGPVYIELSTAISPTAGTGSGDPSGSVDAPPLIEQTIIPPVTEPSAAPLPEVPSLTALPDVPAPQPAAPTQTSTGSAPSTQTQAQPSSNTGTASGTSSGTSTGARSSATSGGSGSNAVQQLQFGVGAGRQPAPTYPTRALSRGHEGTVVVQFTVTESGQVVDAKAVEPSPYAELNSAAISTIRRRWKFPAGQTRTYQIAINFQIR